MKKMAISGALSAALLLTGGLYASAAEHVAGQHDFGDPFEPYLNTKLVEKYVIADNAEVDYKGTKVLETQAQYYTRDNGDGGTKDGSLTEREYGNIKNVMFAYTVEPTAPGKYPAVLMLHGGGGTADTMRERAREFAANGYVAMAIDIPALYGTITDIDVNGTTEKRSHGSYTAGDRGPRFKVTEEDGGAKNSDLVDAEVGVIQAFNYLAQNEKVDSSRMGIMGSSWGGYSTTFVSGILGDKVKAAYSQYGSGFYGPTPDGRQFDSYWTDAGHFPTDAFAIEEWYRYLDPSSHLDNIKAAYYMDAAAKDTFFRPRMVEATLAKAAPTAEYTNHVWSYNRSHESISNSGSYLTYMNYWLKGEGDRYSKTDITGSTLNSDGSNTVTISVNAPAEPRYVKLMYSISNTGWKDRDYKEIATEKMSEGTYTATIPSDIVAQGADYYALTCDSTNIAYSSSMMKSTFTQPVSVNGTPTLTRNGETVYTAAPGTTEINVPVKNNDFTEKNTVEVFAALYKNGSLEKLVSSDKTELNTDEERMIKVSMDIPEYSADELKNCELKLMIWDSKDGMKPCSKSYKIGSVDEAPTKPENVTIKSNSYQGITIGWEPSEDNLAVTGYNIYRKGSDGEVKKIAAAAGNATEYTDASFDVNEHYTYYIAAFDGSGTESERAEVKVDSIEGAVVLLNEYDPSKGTTINGKYMSAQLEKTPGDGRSFEYMPNYVPMQDSIAHDCIKVENTKERGLYINLKVDDNYIFGKNDNKLAVIVTFVDNGFDAIRMQYPTGEDNKYKGVKIVDKLNEFKWRTATYIIEDADFENYQGGNDLRMNFDNGYTNYISKIQIVNLSDELAVTDKTENSITLTWRSMPSADKVILYRDGEPIADFTNNERSFTDSDLVKGQEYEYKLTAVYGDEEREIKTIKAETEKPYVAYAELVSGESKGIKAAVPDSAEIKEIDGVQAKVISSDESSSFAVDNTLLTGTGSRLVTFKYNDMGNKLSMRVGMQNSPIDRAHYFYTNGTGKWETATVLIPSIAFKNNAEDIQLRSTAKDLSYAIADVKVSECRRLNEGGTIYSGVASGLTADNGLFNSTLATWNTSNANITVDTDGEDSVLVMKSVGSNPTLSVVPDYRYLGQDYSNAKLPGNEGFDTTPAMVRPIKVVITCKGDEGAELKINGAKLKLDENGKGSIAHPDDDKTEVLTGEWQTIEAEIPEFYMCGSSMGRISDIKFTAANLPEDGSVMIKSINILNANAETAELNYEADEAETEEIAE